MASFPSALLSELDPSRLAYLAALRGVVPPKHETPFSYAQMTSNDPEGLIALAASNPRDSFFGLMPSEAVAQVAQNEADRRQVSNLVFLAGTPSELLQKIEKKPDYLPALSYFVVEAEDLTGPDSQALFKLLDKIVAPGGLVVLSYPASANDEASFDFLMAEFPSEMDKAETLTFMKEIRSLNPIFFASRPALCEAMDEAIAKDDPSLFLSTRPTQTRSGALEAMMGMMPLHFAFSGDAETRTNYMELSVPVSAHPVLEKYRDNLLYEPLKDFALSRKRRFDLWCRLPADQATDKPTLFGAFTFGLTRPRRDIPAVAPILTGSIDLDAPLFSKLIDLMDTLPFSIGDFLAHPTGQGESPDDVLSSIQILVALGFVAPLRGRFENIAAAVIADFHWSNDFNAFYEEEPVQTGRVLLASPTAGRPFHVSARELLVMQAVSRGGIVDSVAPLLTELLRLAEENPALVAQLIDTPYPSVEQARFMIQDVMSKSMLRWYAYGLLAA